MKNNYLAVMSVATVLACVPFSTQAVSIDSTSWSCNLTESAITSAGDYFSSTLTPESTTGLTCNGATLSVTGTAASDTAWTVSARLASPVSGLTVELIRTDIGSGDSTPTGGDNYIALSTANTMFFSGAGNVSSIPLSFRVSNFGVEDGRDWNANNSIHIEYEVVTQ
ncbi:MAG: hypothetical protein ACWA5U_03425 [bacterium]